VGEGRAHDEVYTLANLCALCDYILN
jgi:hypothetical protein